MKAHLIYTFLFLLLSSIYLVAQIRINWDILADVQFVSEYDVSLGTVQDMPRFGEEPEAYEGKLVELSGYTIPIDGTGTYYVLSKFPYADCYFCGNAGPETIVEISLRPEEQRRFKTDEKVVVRGILKLNDRNVYRLPYLLIEAEIEKM